MHTAPRKGYAILTNYHACIAMSTMYMYTSYFVLSTSTIILTTKLLCNNRQLILKKSDLGYHTDRIAIFLRLCHTSIQSLFIFCFDLNLHKLISSCFIHVQQHIPPQFAGAGHPCYNRSLFRIAW